MKNHVLLFLSFLFIGMVIQGCKREHLGEVREGSAAQDKESITALKHDDGEWSVPVHLGPEVNSASRELGAEISSDGLSLYFNSDRPAPVGFESFNIYVSQRECLDCPWQPAQIVGPPISGPGNDAAPSLSHDGHLIFFSSDLAGNGGLDIWVSHRKNQNDDFGWEAPVNLGPLVNSAGDEVSPSFVGGGEHSELYFNRGGMTWVAPISQHGMVLGPAVQVDLGGAAQSASVRKDGRELVFWAGTERDGIGELDLWVLTRSHMGDAWSTPVNLGAPVNTIGGELEGGLSDDGKTLVFSGTMTRGSSLGRQDIWIATRTHR
jgi:hypothetical protein